MPFTFIISVTSWNQKEKAKEVRGLASVDSLYLSTHEIAHRSRFDEPRTGPKGGLRGLMYKNVDTLHRIRHTHSNLSALRNPSYDGGPLPILAPFSMEPRRLSMKARARRRNIPLEGGAHIAETVILSCTQDVLEHAGFEGELSIISVTSLVNANSTGRGQQSRLEHALRGHGRFPLQHWQDDKVPR
jgi:hypothetical protein